MNYVIILVLLLLSALFSGMNLGLMSLDPYELERKINLGNKEAAKIYPVRRRGNLLLVTLLMGNVAVISTMSIFLDSIAHGIVAGIATTLLVTIFGEILPQSLFSRYALSIGSRLVWIIEVFMILLWPICAPLAWVLDRVLGDELPTIYSKKELIHIIEEHRNSKHSDLDRDEERIVRGALTFGDKVVGDIMTPRSVIVALHIDQSLTSGMLNTLRKSGHSRFPVWSKSQDEIVGILYWRSLVGHAVIGKPVAQLCEPKVYYLNETDRLDDALNAFLRTKHHLFMVVNEFEEIQGIVTMEDVLEEVIDKEIVDEFDQHTDMRAVAKKRRTGIRAI